MPALFATGVATFVATNLDDVLILVAFFSQANGLFRPRHVVIGQYLGFTVLIAVSLIGFFTSLVIPRPWVGLLGFAPLIIGIRQLSELREAEDTTGVNSRFSLSSKASVFDALLNPYTYQVAAVTVANGGDNIGIYAPLFASSTTAELGIILSLFFVLVGVLCFVSYRLTRQPAMAAVLTRYGRRLLPFVLIALGIFILIENDTGSLLIRSLSLRFVALLVHRGC